MNSMSPLISIVMPVWNCAATLNVAVQSILRQSFEDWELLILDDGSRDETLAVARGIRDSRIRVIDEQDGNRGLAYRLNRGVALARAPYVARMDGDDISFPQRLQRQIEFLSGDKGIDLVGCGMVIFHGAGKLVGEQRARTTHQQICGSAFRSCLLPHATWVGKTDWFRRNPYRSEIRRAEDRELLLRTRDNSRFAGIPETLYAYRVDQVSIRTNARARREYLRAVLADACRRRDWTRYCVTGTAELAKLGIDTFALGTHTERWLLRHRARSIQNPALAAQWSALYTSLQAGEC